MGRACAKGLQLSRCPEGSAHVLMLTGSLFTIFSPRNDSGSANQRFEFGVFAGLETGVGETDYPFFSGLMPWVKPDVLIGNLWDSVITWGS